MAPNIFYHRRRLFSAILFFLFTSQTHVFAQGLLNSLDRAFEAMILSGSNFPEFIGSSIEQGENVLLLYAYRRDSQQWQQIPFQWDERDTSNSFFNATGDQIQGLDDNDELAFMAADAGDWAPGSWVNDASSENFIRYEIQVTDPLDPLKSGWAYLYKSLTLQETFVDDYVTYIPSLDPATGQDFVESSVYRIGGNEKGIFGFLSLQPNPEINLFDRQKIRGKTSFFLLPSFDEESDLSFVSVEAIDGPVRIIRQITFQLVGLLDVSLPLQYFRNTVVLAGNLNIPAEIKVSFFDVKVQEIRHSIDLSAAAAGMKMFNPNNTDILINGIDDPNVNKQIEFLPNVNYIHITGEQGTIVNLFEIPATIGDNRQLFYEDKQGIGDPGDGNSFGDSGVQITGSDIEGQFPLALKLIFLEPNQPSTVASQLADFEENPLTVSIMPQTIGTVPVELTTFTATVETNNVRLQWTTATETDNFGFNIQRKLQGNQMWQIVGFVEGNGTIISPSSYQFNDDDVRAGQWLYRLQQVDTDGSFAYSQELIVFVGLPETFTLAQNFPNPFNPSTLIQYTIPANFSSVSKQRTTVTIFNLLGEKIVTLVDKAQTPGSYTVTWDGKDRSGHRVSSGIYVYRLQSGQFSTSKRMVFIK